MARMKLDPEMLSVEAFAAAEPRETPVLNAATVPCPTTWQTCTNCLDDTCIC